MGSEKLPLSRDKLLFTPGPLTTSLSVKQAMLHDAGSWHYEFSEVVQKIRTDLLKLANLSQEDGYECILVQGSGTFGVEAVIGSIVPPDGKLLVVANGAYGERMVQMAGHLRVGVHPLRCPENETPDLGKIASLLASDRTLSALAVVHCETTTGILNPIIEIGKIAQENHCVYIVDAMSSFGGLEIDFAQSGVDFLISSPNKCLEGVPGFSFVMARRRLLLASEGNARSLSLDLLGQWKGFEKNGQFRFTPPTHAILALEQALRELEKEGGIPARARRYQSNHTILMAGMRKLGFAPYLPAAVQSPIITSFYYPNPPFNFTEFYRRLAEKGMIIYPGKISQVDCFRIGSIGRIVEMDIRALLAAIEETLDELGIKEDQRAPRF